VGQCSAIAVQFHNFQGECMNKVFMLVAVAFLGACAGKAETSQQADSTAAPVAGTTAVVADSTTVAPVTGEAVK